MKFEFGPDIKGYENDWWKLELDFCTVLFGWNRQAFLRLLIRTRKTIYEVPILPNVKIRMYVESEKDM